MNLSTPISRFRFIAILEGISYLLFAVTMPLKYSFELPEPNYFVGMIHGGLFVAYIALALQNILIYRWKLKTSALVLIASIIPGGTFYVDTKVLKPLAHDSHIQ